jgi:mannose/fructose/N-acetylgalactosamine-specific phosphotransferase system component IID
MEGSDVRTTQPGARVRGAVVTGVMVAAIVLASIVGLDSWAEAAATHDVRAASAQQTLDGIAD